LGRIELNEKSLKKVSLILLILLLTLTATSAQPPPEMISYWKFDEGAGTTAFDSIDANHGKIYGASWTTGIVDSALSFDGTDDNVLVPDSPGLCPTDEITIEAWIMPIDLEWWFSKHIVAKGDPDYYDYNIPNSAYDFFVRNYDGYQLEFSARFEGGYAGYRTGPSTLTPYAWNHVAAIYNGSYVKLYVNGNCMLEQPQTGKIVHSTFPNMSLQIGASISTRPGYPSVCHFKGTIDEVAIYNQALTGEEILQHYENGLKGGGYLLSTRTTFFLDPNPAIWGQTITLFGNLTTKDNNPIASAPVTIKLSGVPVATLQTNSSGWFQVSGRVMSAGTFNITVEYAGSTQYLPSLDREVLVVNKAETSIYAIFVPNPVNSGGTCMLKGILVDQFSNPIKFATLSLEYSTDYGSTWKFAGILTTNSHGIFSKTFTAPSPATYIVRISYAGSPSYEPSTADTPLVVR
jgi:hypothetical protein